MTREEKGSLSGGREFLHPSSVSCGEEPLELQGPTDERDLRLLQNALLKLLGDKKPEHIAVVFDAKGPTFRHALYDQYKATRPPAPEDLVVQFPYIRAIVQGLGLAMIEKEGYEADDIIGTLARRGEEQGYKIMVVTGDKDFRQILSPSVMLWDTMKDKVTSYETFREEYGLEPGQMIDVMGLSGDNSISRRTAGSISPCSHTLGRVLQLILQLG